MNWRKTCSLIGPVGRVEMVVRKSSFKNLIWPKIGLWVMALSGASLHAQTHSPFVACAGQMTGARAPIQAFTTTLETEITSQFEIARAEIVKNLICLSDRQKNAGEDCDERLRSLNEDLPIRWTQYRMLRALSAWDSSFVAGPRATTVPFNWQLEKPNRFWPEQVPMAPLTATETEHVQKLFVKESKKTRLMVAQEIDRLIMSLPTTAHLERAHLKMEAQQIRNLGWGPLMQSRSAAAGRLQDQFQSLVFALNKKRMQVMLEQYPILAYLSAPTISPEGLRRALIKMLVQLNSSEEQLKRAMTKQNWPDVLDHVPILEATLKKHPHFCDLASGLWQSETNRQFWTDIALGAVVVTVVIVAPPAASMVAVAALQTYQIVTDASHLNAAQQTALSSGAEIYDLAPLFEQSQSLNETLQLAPLTVVAAPLFRLRTALALLK